MYGSTVRGRSDGVGLFAEGDGLDLTALLVVRLTRPVGHALPLHATTVPDLHRTIVRACGEEGAVWAHLDPEVVKVKRPFRQI